MNANLKKALVRLVALAGTAALLSALVGGGSWH
jgi:hypothetical protein